jgi:hypothetical protein
MIMNLRFRSFVRNCIPLFALVGISSLQSCEHQTDAIVDPTLTRPFVLAGTITPDTLRTSTLPQSGGMISAAITTRATVYLPAGSQPLSAVTADLVDPVTGETIKSLALVRDTTIQDSSAGILHFTGTLSFTLPKSVSGRYTLRISASTGVATGTSVVERSVYFLRDNHPPVLSNLVVPDSVLVPAGGSANFVAKVTAYDPDGQSDIAQVFFVNLDSSDPTHRYTLLDDGSAPPSNSGDDVAGDGIYTITVTAPSSAKGKIYRFVFQATDAFGDTSASILHFLKIK